MGLVLPVPPADPSAPSGPSTPTDPVFPVTPVFPMYPASVFPIPPLSLVPPAHPVHPQWSQFPSMLPVPPADSSVQSGTGDPSAPRSGCGHSASSPAQDMCHHPLNPIRANPGAYCLLLIGEGPPSPSLPPSLSLAGHRDDPLVLWGWPRLCSCTPSPQGAGTRRAGTEDMEAFTEREGE